MPGEEGATLKMRRYLSILLTIVMMISGLMPGALAEDDTVY